MSDVDLTLALALTGIPEGVRGLKNIGDAADDAQDGLDKVGDAAKNADKGLDKVKQSSKDAGAGLERTGRGAKDADAGLERTSSSARRAQSGLDGVRTSARGAGETLATSGSRSRRAAEDIETLRQRLDKTGVEARQMGRSMTVGVTTPLVAVAGLSFRQFANFDQTIRQVGSVADISGRQLDGMRETALKLGKDTSFSANEAATAMLELAKGGISQAQMSAGVLDQTLTLAAAGSLELGAAAGYMTNTLNAFGLKASQAGAVAAALAGGALESTASVESLGMGLAQVGQGAVQAGQNLNGTIAALALFENRGVKGSDAGTSLKTMLARLVPQTNEAAEAMTQLGLDFVDAQGNILPMRDIAQQLQDKLGGLSEAQRVSALNTIFGSDASRAAGIMAEAGGAGIDKMTAATKNLNAAQDLAKTNTEGATGAIEQMMGSVETAGISIGDQLAPHIIDVAGKVEDAADRFGEFDDGTQKMILAIAGVAAVAGPALMVFGSMATGAAMITPVVTAGAGAVLALGTAIGGLGVSAAASSPALGVMGAAIATNPLLAGAVGAAAIVGVGVALTQIAGNADTVTMSMGEAAASVTALTNATRSLEGLGVSIREAALSESTAQRTLAAAHRATAAARAQHGVGSAEHIAAREAETRADVAAQRATVGVTEARRREADTLDTAIAKAKENTEALEKEKKKRKEIQDDIGQMTGRRIELNPIEATGNMFKQLTGGLDDLNRHLEESEGKSAASKKALNGLRAEFTRVYGDASKTTGKVRELAVQLGMIPADTTAKVSADTAAAYANVSAFRQLLANLPRDVRINVTEVHRKINNRASEGTSDYGTHAPGSQRQDQSRDGGNRGWGPSYDYDVAESMVYGHAMRKSTGIRGSSALNKATREARLQQTEAGALQLAVEEYHAALRAFAKAGPKNKAAARSALQSAAQGVASARLSLDAARTAKEDARQEAAVAAPARAMERIDSARQLERAIAENTTTLTDDVASTKNAIADEQKRQGLIQTQLRDGKLSAARQEQLRQALDQSKIAVEGLTGELEDLKQQQKAFELDAPARTMRLTDAIRNLDMAMADATEDKSDDITTRNNALADEETRRALIDAVLARTDLTEEERASKLDEKASSVSRTNQLLADIKSINEQIAETAKQSLQAQLDQALERARIAEANLQISEGAFGVLNGSGDIGVGGFANAISAARSSGVPFQQIVIQSPLPPTAQQLAQYADFAAQGAQYNGTNAMAYSAVEQIGA